MREKLLFFMAVFILAFILFIVRVFFGAPILLIVIMLLVIVLGIVHRSNHELLHSVFPKKMKAGTDLQTAPADEPPRHKPESKTYLVLTSIHASSRSSIIVDQPSYIIGRSRECDHTIDNQEVSSRHLQIDYREEEKLCYATDLNSTNHTLLNNVLVRPGNPLVLHQGDIIQIANEVYQVEYAHF